MEGERWREGRREMEVVLDGGHEGMDDGRRGGGGEGGGALSLPLSVLR